MLTMLIYVCVIFYIYIFQVWEEGGLKLPSCLFPLSFPSIVGIHPHLSLA